MRRIILPVLGGFLIAALTACLFWLVDRYLL
jgi:membrane-associated phospholipid phosphatase